jgi:hypothetical protein
MSFIKNNFKGKGSSWNNFQRFKILELVFQSLTFKVEIQEAFKDSKLEYCLNIDHYGFPESYLLIIFFFSQGGG